MVSPSFPLCAVSVEGQLLRLLSFAAQGALRLRDLQRAPD